MVGHRTSGFVSLVYCSRSSRPRVSCGPTTNRAQDDRGLDRVPAQHVFDEADLAAAGALAKIRIEQRSGAISDHAGLIRSTLDFDLQIHSSGAATQNGAASAESRARILREIAALEKTIGNSERQLGDATFLSKAPEKIVVNLRAKLAEYQEQLAANRKLLEKFPPQ